MNRIEKIRQIVSEKQYASVDGVLVDLFTASAIIRIYDQGSDGAKKLIEELPIEKLGKIALELTVK